MAARAYWKGYLKLSLVTCPVSLFPATSQSDKTHFHQINRKTGNRLRQQMVDESTGKVVESEDKGRGYELSKGKYVEIESEELEAVEVESTHTIDIEKFVPEDEIDKRYYERPYYVVPEKDGAEAFAVIRDAMKDKAAWLSLVSFSQIANTSWPWNLGAKACSGLRCVTITKCEKIRSSLRTFPPRARRRTWWTSPLISSIASPESLTLPSSRMSMNWHYGSW